MRTVRIERDFQSWRKAARRLLQQAVRPDEIFWDDGTAEEGLFSELENEAVGGSNKMPQIMLPKAFVELARWVSCHSDRERWSLLYRLSWRISIGGERHLLNLETDDAVRQANVLAKAIRRDRHKMTAFVRFRKTGVNPENGREQFVAWFEPDHFIVELTAPFFQSRFTSMDWSIMTPDCCAHWNGKSLAFTPGISKKDAPQDEDGLDDYWRSYYAHIFNPARLKLKAMQAEMPVKYWKNLPEAPLIAELTRKASLRTSEMIDAGVNGNRGHVSGKIPSGVPRFEQADRVDPAAVLAKADDFSLAEIGDCLTRCDACGICGNATGPVFGEGPSDASVMLIGEQPGDQEDIAGTPFVGPAGELLNRALAAAGLAREKLYVTNTVKGFKWKASTQGRKRRLHDSANRGEVNRCKPWLLAEIMKVRPQKIVLLGATAGRVLLGNDFRLMKERGVIQESALAELVVATVHPSYLLRLTDSNERDQAFASFVDDLKLIA